MPFFAVIATNTYVCVCVLVHCVAELKDSSYGSTLLYRIVLEGQVAVCRLLYLHMFADWSWIVGCSNKLLIY